MKYQNYALSQLLNIVNFTDHRNWPIKRNYQKHLELMSKTADKKGCIRIPVMKFDCDHYPPDMLHMKKGIISKLVDQLVDWTVIQGKEKSLVEEMKKHKIPFV